MRRLFSRSSSATLVTVTSREPAAEAVESALALQDLALVLGELGGVAGLLLLGGFGGGIAGIRGLPLALSLSRGDARGDALRWGGRPIRSARGADGSGGGRTRAGKEGRHSRSGVGSTHRSSSLDTFVAVVRVQHGSEEDRVRHRPVPHGGRGGDAPTALDGLKRDCETPPRREKRAAPESADSSAPQGSDARSRDETRRARSKPRGATLEGAAGECRRERIGATTR